MPARRVDVKALRDEMGLTRRQLARKVPISLRSIERHESETNIRDMSRAATAHLDRLLTDFRKEQQRHPASKHGRANGNGNTGQGKSEPAPAPEDAPRRRPLPTSHESTTPVIVRAFGRAGPEESP